VEFADGGSVMTKSLKLAVLAVFGLAMTSSVAAQNKPGKSPGKSSAIHHTQVRHRSSTVAMPDDSKKLNNDLAKLESQSSKAIRPARTRPEKRVLPAKTFNQQDRRNNPPINFSYNGKNGGSSSHKSGASQSSGTPVKASPRMR
jgi:hypothetical protein